MTSTDRNYLVPAQEKLEWVTPKISLMDAGETWGNKQFNPTEPPQGRWDFGVFGIS